VRLRQNIQPTLDRQPGLSILFCVMHHCMQVYITMQMLFLHDEGFDKSVAAALTWQREWTDADWSILSLVDTVLTGQASGEEQMAVQLDRALATSGKTILDHPCQYVWLACEAIPGHHCHKYMLCVSHTACIPCHRRGCYQGLGAPLAATHTCNLALSWRTYFSKLSQRCICLLYHLPGQR